MKSNLEGLKAAYAAATKGKWVALDVNTSAPYLVSEQEQYQDMQWNNPVVCNFYDDVSLGDSVMETQYQAHDNFGNNSKFIALAHNLTPALISAVDILTSILNAHASGNNGAYMGEAILCPYFAKAAKSVLNDLGVKTYVASE